MESILSIMMVGMLLFVGGFGSYTAVRLMKLKYLFPSKFLYPSNCSPEDCLDAPGFIRFIVPRLLILSVSSLVCGIALLLISTMKLIELPRWVDLYLLPGVMVLFFAWYIWVQSRCYKRFW